ncbi:MAG: murein L,D-transpeptidase, partial [Oscillochloridaceae bacterium umkhey_bin13]
MSYREAQAAVREAQAREAELRNALLPQQASAVNADLLPRMQTVYFAQTGHHVSNRSGFLDFWRANGQIHGFGFPITE